MQQRQPLRRAASIVFLEPHFRKMKLIRKIAFRPGNRNHAFGKPCLCWRDTRHFRHFRRLGKALVLLVRLQIRHFRLFRQNPLILAGDKGTVYQKHRFWVAFLIKGQTRSHPAAKGVQQKEFWQNSDEKSDRSIRKSDRKSDRKSPENKKSDRAPFADVLLRPNAERDHVERGFAAKPPEK